MIKEKKYIKLKKLQDDYEIGLNYIKQSKNAKSLEKQYIYRLKVIKNELLKYTTLSISNQKTLRRK